MRGVLHACRMTLVIDVHVIGLLCRVDVAIDGSGTASALVYRDVLMCLVSVSVGVSVTC